MLFPLFSGAGSGKRSSGARRYAAPALSALLSLSFAAPGFSAPLGYRLQQDATPATPAKTAPATAPAFAYTRDVKGKDGTAQAVQTAIRRFDPVNGKGPSVYLVAAVHIGEKSYYQGVQQFLNKQDVVLFEMVKPSVKGRGPKPSAPAETDADGKPKETSAGLQKKLSKALNLQFQLEAINYKQANFRNSDLSWDDMEDLAAKSGDGTKKSLEELGNTLGGGPNAGFAGTLLNGMVGQADANPAFAQMFRRIIVNIIANPDKLASLRQQSQGSDQAKLQTILVAERNKVVLADLKALKEDTQKPVKSVAVFYGAEHMRDMEQHLVADLGYRAADTKWVTAIKATP
jgi:hypothetical protein